MKAICNIDVSVDFQAQKTSSQTEKVPQGKKPGAKNGLGRKQSSKYTSESKTEASKSKTGQSDKRTQSSSSKDKSPSHPSASTHVVAEMHKEVQQAVGGPTSLGATSEEGAHPQLSSGMSAFTHIEHVHSASFTFHSESTSGCDASADSTAEDDPGKFAPNDSIPSQQDKTKYARDGLKTAHTDLGTNEESRSDETSKKIKLEDLLNLMHDTSSAFFSPDSLVDESIIVSDESDEEETQRNDTHVISHDKPKDTSVPPPPSPRSVQLQELVSYFLVQENLKTLDALPSLLNKVTATLNMFVTIIENASSGATGMSVPSAGKADASPAEGEKNINPATKDVETTNMNNELVDLMGIDVVEKYHNKKLIYDKYYDK
ncbi:hypothetical protein Tco_0213958 [Tanacetum coccineum]